MTSYALLCQYHIIKSVRGKIKGILRNKSRADMGNDKTYLKILEPKIMEWSVIINSSINESYVNYVMKFISVYEKYHGFLRYV